MHTPAMKAQAILGALDGRESVRGEQRLVISRSPSEVEGGFEVWVRLYVNGEEVHIDPHRVFINPPLRIGGETDLDPQRAFWAMLWGSVTSTPHRRGWRSI